jgi:hypothetical protein
VKKRAKVHLLPTDKASRLVKFQMFGKNKLNYSDEILPIQDEEQYHHLYFTTDEEIKEGDWFMFYGEPRQAKNLIAEPVNQGKIIATTDPKLHSTRLKDCPINPEDNMVSVRGVSKPSKEFIEEYCRAGGIDEVDVEYGLFHDGNFKDDNETHAFKAIRKPKVTSNNEIIIHSIEEKMKTREQAQARALELYPIKDVGADYPVDANEVLRKAFLKCFDEMQESKQEEVDYQTMFANCKLPNEKPQPQEKVGEPSDIYDEKLMDLLWQVKEGKVHPNRAWKTLLKLQANTLQDNELRMAAEKVVYEWHNSVGEECIDAAMVKLVRVLNSKKH